MRNQQNLLGFAISISMNNHVYYYSSKSDSY